MMHRARIVAISSIRVGGRMWLWNSELPEHFVQCFEGNGLNQARVPLTSVHIR